jgi:hypothetical protein
LKPWENKAGLSTKFPGSLKLKISSCSWKY